jgi:hypothetical protein
VKPLRLITAFSPFCHDSRFCLPFWHRNDSGPGTHGQLKKQCPPSSSILGRLWEGFVTFLPSYYAQQILPLHALLYQAETDFNGFRLQ